MSSLFADAEAIIVHAFGHDADCRCMFPRDQQALKARLLAKRGLTEQRPVSYDPARYAPKTSGGGLLGAVARNVANNNALMRRLGKS